MSSGQISLSSSCQGPRLAPLLGSHYYSVSFGYAIPHNTVCTSPLLSPSFTLTTFLSKQNVLQAQPMALALDYVCYERAVLPIPESSSMGSRNPSTSSPCSHPNSWNSYTLAVCPSLVSSFEVNQEWRDVTVETPASDGPFKTSSTCTSDEASDTPLRED